MTLVVITHNEQIEPAIMQALERLPLEQLTRGKVVAVKPNDTWASAQDRTGVTQPDTLRAVLRAIKRFQPRELIVTGGSGAGETDEIFEVAGLMDVVRQEQAVFVDHNRPPFQEIPLTYAADKEVAGPQRTIMVNPCILTYETLIVVSQLKMHSTATVTLALKNIAMSFPAADYYGHPRASHPERHHFMEDMHSFIAAMHHRFPAHLAITVGHPAMVASGPLGGYTAETGLVIASTDTLAADVVGAQILGLSVQAVRHLWEASRLGPGVASISQMEFPVLQLKDAIKIFTRKVYGKELTFEHS